MKISREAKLEKLVDLLKQSRGYMNLRSLREPEDDKKRQEIEDGIIKLTREVEQVKAETESSTIRSTKDVLNTKTLIYDKKGIYSEDYPLIPYTEAIEAIEEYHNQFQSPSEQLPTLKQIADKAKSDCETIYDDEIDPQTKMLSKNDVAQAAYANGYLNCYLWISQFKQQSPVSGMMDEEIEKWANKEVYLNNNCQSLKDFEVRSMNSFIWEGLVRGAKAYRDGKITKLQKK